MATRCSWPDLRNVLAAAALVFAGLRVAQASEEVFYEVAQPVESAAGIEIVHTTYASYGSTCCLPVLYTCRANSLATDSGVQNRNLANLIGIAVTVKGNTRPDLPDWMCDTLDVQLDLGAVAAHEPRYGSKGIEEIVQRTIACIRENAGICNNELKILRLHVTGPEKFRKLGKTYSVTRYRASRISP
jgi:hypothetical protein